MSNAASYLRSRRNKRGQRDAGAPQILLCVAKFAGLKALQLVAGIALGVAGLAVADSVTDSPTLHALVAVGFVIIAALMAWSGWVAHARAGRHRRRNLSNDSQTHNLSIRGLSRRFRRG